MTINDLKELSLEDILKLIDKGDVTDAIVYTLPLDTALSNYAVSIAGNYISCIDASDAGVSVNIEFNKISTGMIDFSKGLSISRPFNRFFITSSAQTGKTISFLISSYATDLFEVTDNRSNNQSSVSLAAIEQQLIGDTTGTMASDNTIDNVSAEQIITGTNVQTSFLLFADLANTGTIYIGFDNTVSATKKIMALNSGDTMLIDNFKGDIWAFASGTGQKLSVSYW